LEREGIKVIEKFEKTPQMLERKFPLLLAQMLTNVLQSLSA